MGSVKPNSIGLHNNAMNKHRCTICNGEFDGDKRILNRTKRKTPERVANHPGETSPIGSVIQLGAIDPKLLNTFDDQRFPFTREKDNVVQKIFFLFVEELVAVAAHSHAHV